MEQVSTFGERLRTLMEERGLSYDALGAKVGMNPQTLNRYVLGRREPKAGVAAIIALMAYAGLREGEVLYRKVIEQILL